MKGTHKHSRVAPPEKVYIVDLYRSLSSIKAVSREVGVSEQTVRRALLDAGEYTSPRVTEIT